MLKKICLLWVFFSGPLFADSLADAMAAYDQGDFKKSAGIYEELISIGTRNGSVYFNLANSYFRMGEKGKAVAAYLAARSLLPRDPDVKANLKFVHDQMVDKLAIHSSSSIFRELAFWVDRTTPKEILLFSAVLGCITLCLLFFSLVVRNLAFLRVWSVSFSFIAFLGFCVFGTSLYYAETWGAVSSLLSEVRSGPGEQNTIVFRLHEGAPFLVDAREGDW
jgi:tetratricopeptide (TPR) repeat protein